MRAHSLSAALVAVLMSTGCPDETVSESDGAQRLAAAMCDRTFECGCDSDSDPATCEPSHVKQLLVFADWAAESPGAEIDAVCLHELAQCWEQAECGVPVLDPRPCELDCVAYSLNLDSGENCGLPSGSEGFEQLVSTCAAGLTCQGGHGYAVCDDETPLALGDACDDRGGHRRCGSGLFCDDAGTDRCVAYLEEGSACDSSLRCASGLACLENTCRPKSAEGEGCMEAPCAIGLACHVTQQTCVAPLSVGQQCRFADTPMIVPCVSEAWCGDEVCEARQPATMSDLVCWALPAPY